RSARALSERSLRDRELRPSRRRRGRRGNPSPQARGAAPCPAGRGTLPRPGARHRTRAVPGRANDWHPRIASVILDPPRLPPPSMSDDSPGPDARRPLFERLAALLLRVPEDREQLLGVLRQAHDRSLLDADALSMIEGVLQVAELSAIDVMVPRAQMDVIDVSEPPENFLPKVIATAHSRFPVVEGDRDNVVGILHAKELLRM